MSQPFYKYCITCPEGTPRKPIREFYSKGKKGLVTSSYCMECHKKRVRERYARKRVEILAKSREKRIEVKMETEFKLIYWHRTVPNKKLLVKRIILGEYVTLDPETGNKEPMTKHELMRDYFPDKGNIALGRGIRKAREGKRMTRADSKAFADYLNGASA